MRISISHIVENGEGNVFMCLKTTWFTFLMWSVSKSLWKVYPVTAHMDNYKYADSLKDLFSHFAEQGSSCFPCFRQEEPPSRPTTIVAGGATPGNPRLAESNDRRWPNGAENSRIAREETGKTKNHIFLGISSNCSFQIHDSRTQKDVVEDQITS